MVPLKLSADKVEIGMSAVRSACRYITRAWENPLACAVRTKSELIISSIEARWKRLYAAN